MAIGPLELVVLGFEGNNFKGEISTAIEEEVASGSIRVVDLIFARKDADGAITVDDLDDADESFGKFEGLAADLRKLLTEDDAITLAELLPANTAALVALIEHTWATRIAEAVNNAGGRLLASQRISPRLIEEIRDELEAAMSDSS